jgi:arylsulfatase A
MKILTTLLLLATSLPTLAETKPNIILIFADDLGYNDLSSFRSKKIKTPNLDRLAQQGRKFTNFLVACSVCTPSRAALLTACYPKRIDMETGVLFPVSKKGINPNEYTIADHLKSSGYATTAIGKWHLGHYPETLPRALGFDSYYGIPYSNDMNHPVIKAKVSAADDSLWAKQDEYNKKWNIPLVENESIIELPVNQRTITRRYSDRAIEFIEKNKSQPFFIYLAQTMPHVPLFVPEDVLDPNPKNAFTNTIQHMDTEIGRIIDKIHQENLQHNTIFIFTSDNGPWLPYKHHGGSAFPLRDGKSTPFEGGHRVPLIISAPGRIPPNTSSDELITAIDLLPSLASIIQSPLPENLPEIDGIDLSKTITSDTPSSRPNFIYYAPRGIAVGIRSGNWKLLRIPPNENSPLFFDLSSDISETNNLADKHPERVKELTELMNSLDQELQKNKRPAWTTKNQHPWPPSLN